MSNTIRIKTTPNGGDKYIKVNLEQDFDFIEILSLKISQEEAYTKFCSDYGTIVGRVTVNNGFGVPNAKVSVFIPLDENDKTNSEIKNIYPFEVISDKTSDGKRYNLLTKEQVPNNDCFTPIGSFPSKREILDNPTMLEVYCKYYKYTTTTNHAGDFMLFGVPLGTYTVHVDADISDIGIISQRPYDLISQGTPEKMFESPTKFKSSNNLDSLLQIKTVNTGVNVEPFWGDTDNCQIGITRLDIPLNHTVIPSAIFIGSLFGDNEKHSVNKQCRPRNKVGVLCEQTTGAGSIEMVRRTFEGQIERFDVEGGRVIDDDGTWSYQVPMNLDYVVTDEEGNLIYSQDSNIGIPTRSSVRFRIGLDESGGEGKKRTRAKYLVPNNPSNQSEIDYNFGSETKDSSFYNMYWNKIYTVKNFIPRYQTTSFTNGLPYLGNAYTGIKDVTDDKCSGNITTFPYNRINTEVNSIFSSICIILTIMIAIITLINAILITSINAVIWVIRTVVRILNNFISAIINGVNIFLPDSAELDVNKYKLPAPNYVPCIAISSTCGNEDGTQTHFAPGCIKNGSTYDEVDNSAGVGGGFLELENKYGQGMVEQSGAADCLSFQLAKGLGMFKFDFYNEWVNGTLFSFLLKYKKRRANSNVKGRETFCEYDCDDFTSDPNYTGVDSNQNNNPDNNCNTQYLVDSCHTGPLGNNTNNAQNYGRDSGGIREGLIKKVDDDLYYASTTHNTSFKLFATDIVCLGSIFECDWQGVPKINDLLVPTTFILPPAVAEKDIVNGTTIVSESGMVEIGNGNLPYLFFSVNCVGVHVPVNGCNNVRHICEYGVNTDEYSYNTVGQIVPPNGNIGSRDIDDDSGKWFRDVFYLLNKNGSSPTSFSFPSTPITSEFNTNNQGFYDYVGSNDNGADYLNFKGYSPVNSNAYVQPENSYYFYFGLLNGKTALEKMNAKYFTNCYVQTRDTMTIVANSTPTGKNVSTGSITFTFKQGIPLINYSIIGPNTLINGSVQSNTSTTISNLGAGIYTIEGTDSLGNIVTKNVSVYGPIALSAYAFVSKNSTTTISNDGEITINNINNGVPPYTYTLTDANGNIVRGPITPATSGIINGLPYLDPIGYNLTIKDSTNDTVIINDLVIKGTPIVNGTIVKIDSNCFNSNNGSIAITPKDGKPPYSISTYGPNGYSSTLTNLTGLEIGTYITTITDSSTPAQTSTLTTNITNVSPQMILNAGNSTELSKQCNSTYYKITTYLTYSFGAPTTANLEYLDINNTWVPVSLPYTNGSTPLIFNIPRASIGTSVKIRAVYATTTCYSDILTIATTSIALPNTNLNGTVNTVNYFLVYQHTITASGGLGIITSSPHPIGTFTDSIQTITTTLTDGVGCTKTISG